MVWSCLSLLNYRVRTATALFSYILFLLSKSISVGGSPAQPRSQRVPCLFFITGRREKGDKEPWDRGCIWLSSKLREKIPSEQGWPWVQFCPQSFIFAFWYVARRQQKQIRSSVNESGPGSIFSYFYFHTCPSCWGFYYMLYEPNLFFADLDVTAQIQRR